MSPDGSGRFVADSRVPRAGEENAVDVRRPEAFEAD